MFDLESQLRIWKSHMVSLGSIGFEDVQELENHLRDTIEDLVARGLGEEEAFLLAVKRLGDASSVQEEFRKVSTEDLWLQLLVRSDSPALRRRDRSELVFVIGLALLGGLLAKIPALFGFGDIDAHGMIYLRNAGIFACFPVALYFMRKRSLPMWRSVAALTVFMAYATIVNVYPSFEPHHTAMLGAVHAPILFLYLLMYFYGGPDVAPRGEKKSYNGWRSANTRLNFIRFAGESFIYGVLIGLGGIVLILLTMGTFSLVGIDVEFFVNDWMVPMGLFGILPVAAYLVDKKKSLIESIAPVLAKIFTPLFLMVLVSLVVAFMMNSLAPGDNRMMLIWFDLVLAVVLGLALYVMSSKDPSHGVSLWDHLTLALIIVAIIVDMIAFTGLLARFFSGGFTANKSAALGENILLLGNLVMMAFGYVRYMYCKRSFQDIVVMQMRYLDLYALWAIVVIVLFPPIFSFR